MATFSYEFEAIGTHWHVSFRARMPKISADAAMSDVHERIGQFDQHYSRFRADSLVTRMSHRAGDYVLPDDAQPMLDLYRELYGMTDGAFTPLIGQTISDAGYDASYSLQPRELSRPPALAVLEYAPPRLKLREPALLDFGAAGKGYLADIVGGILKEHGAESYLIDAGGDIVSYSVKGESVPIGLEHPTDASLAIGIAEIRNESICGSSGSKRAWGGFHHIIDPRTLVSPRHVAAVWVVAKTALLADALATCLFFVPPSRLMSKYDFEYLIVLPDDSVEKSSGFRAELFTRV